MWTFVVSRECYITDKWETNHTANGYPISFLRFSLPIVTLRITGTFVSGNTVRLALDGLGFTGKYVDISYNGTVYTYTVDAPSGSTVYPVNGGTSSVLEPIVIQFSADVSGAGNSSNYSLTVTAGPAITDLLISSLAYQSTFNSGSPYLGASLCYLRQRITNLLAAPRVLQVIPQPGGFISALPGWRIDLVLSKPVGDIYVSPPVPESRLDITDVKRLANYELYAAAGLSFINPNPILYENSGLRSANIDNIGKIENVVTLRFTGSLTDGALTIRVNNNSTSSEKIQDSNGIDYLEVNGGNPSYHIIYRGSQRPCGLHRGLRNAEGRHRGCGLLEQHQYQR